MTIEDAIRRAKILGQARIQREKSGEDAYVRPSDSRPVAEERRSAPRAVTPAMHFEPLKSVEISAEACAQHRILLLESQQLTKKAKRKKPL